MTAARFIPCDAQVTIGGATYTCGRPKGHTDDPMTDGDPELHQCIGLQHPTDGENYRMTWSSPRKIIGSAELHRPEAQA